MLTIETKTCAGHREHAVTWPTTPIPAAVFDDVRKWVTDCKSYSPISQDMLRQHRIFLEQLNATHNTQITMYQLQSLRNALMKAKVIKNYQRAQSDKTVAPAAAAYANGMPILLLARERDLPPLNLLHSIFLRTYNSRQRAAIDNVFKEQIPPENVLGDRDLRQYRIAYRNDADSRFNQQLVADIAAHNELALIEYFRAAGVGLRTQEDLVAEQIKKFGRATLTPDILFADPVHVNGVRVYWLDYKNYVGTTVPFLRISNTEQAAKYAAEWGTGVLCYNGGYVADLSITGAILVDATSVPIVYERIEPA